MSIDVDEVKLDFDTIGSVFQKVDKATIIKIMKAYYSNKLSATKLIENFNLNTIPSKLYKNFPCVEMKKKCPYDGSSFRVKMPSKTNFEVFLQGYGETLFCPLCGHVDEPDCDCDNCKLKRENELHEKKAKIREAYKRENFKLVKEEKLSLRDRIYLSALIRGFMDEDQVFIAPLSSSAAKLAPTSDFSAEILQHLIARGIIVPASVSKISAFTEEDFPNQYYLTQVSYQILVATEDDESSLINRLMYPDRQLFLDDKYETYQLWKQIAESEAEEFLLYRMSAVGFDFNVGDKTKMVLNQLLERFSVGQINSFTYRAVANALQWYTENRNISKSHAANSVVSGLEKSGERALAEGWKVKAWTRNYYLGQSEVSEVLYNPIMQVSELGFTEVPTEDF
ncbi:hypothetical protein [Lactiplantibacillus paraxiangfangensis]|uniref:hypothetical protein n=1 Tax=Lactiplantibacillus paraxiangfangensis TaxID=3076224 RepID=UPI0030C6ADA9